MRLFLQRERTVPCLGFHSILYSPFVVATAVLFNYGLYMLRYQSVLEHFRSVVKREENIFNHLIASQSYYKEW